MTEMSEIDGNVLKTWARLFRLVEEARKADTEARYAQAVQDIGCFVVEHAEQLWPSTPRSELVARWKLLDGKSRGDVEM